MNNTIYNYYEEVLKAVEDAANDSYTPEMLEPVDLDSYAEKLNDALWIDDSVTGNASGSFFFNSYEAEEALAGNWDLAAEALAGFAYDDGFNAFAKGAEWIDVVIRCYVLGGCISEYIEQNKDDLTERIERVNS